MRYEIWSNYSTDPRKFLDGLEPGDQLVRTWQGYISETDRNIALDILFGKFNMDDRPNREIAHSLSIGDVVVVDDLAFACLSEGWKSVAHPTFLNNKDLT